EARAQLVGAEHVLQRHRVGHGRDVVGGDLAHTGDRAEDHLELAGEDIQLVVGDGEPGEPGEVSDLLPADVRCRGFGGHVPPGRCAAGARNRCGRWRSAMPRRARASTSPSLVAGTKRTVAAPRSAARREAEPIRSNECRNGVLLTQSTQAEPPREPPLLRRDDSRGGGVYARGRVVCRSCSGSCYRTSRAASGPWPPRSATRVRTSSASTWWNAATGTRWTTSPSSCRPAGRRTCSSRPPSRCPASRSSRSGRIRADWRPTASWS